MGLFGIDREEVLDVRVKRGSDYNYVDGLVLFRVKKGDIIDMMLESGEFGEGMVVDLHIVWVEDWSDYQINGYRVYNVDYNTKTGDYNAILCDRKLKVSYSGYHNHMMGGGTWEYKGDYVQWFRDKKLGDVLGGGCGGS